MRISDLEFDATRLARVCAAHGVERLEAFGSFARGDAESGSDLDLLVTFSPESKVGLSDFVLLQQELEALMGRSVDLMTREAVERSPNKYFRRFALRSVEPLYECA